MIYTLVEGENTDPLQPGSYSPTVKCCQKIWDKSLTFPHGLAMKLGVTPCFMPILLATYLYNTALSAIRRADV